MKFTAAFITAALSAAPLHAVAGTAGAPPQGTAQAETAAVPVLSTIPAGAVVVGSLVLFAGVIIGTVAADDDDETTTTTTTTN